MIKSPCIRGLKRFEKKGCPESCWNETRQDGCTCWVSMPVIDPNNPAKTIKHSCCVDLTAHHQRHQILSLLEGNQKAIETFRNGVVEDTGDGVRPKENLAFKQFMQMVINKKLLE